MTCFQNWAFRALPWSILVGGISWWSIAAGQTTPSPTGKAALPESVQRLLQRGCSSQKGTDLFISPAAPLKDQPLRVIVISTRDHPGAQLYYRGPGGAHSLQVQPGGGPPYFWYAQLDQPSLGRYRVAFVEKDGAALACARRRVERKPPPEEDGPGQWPVRRSWNRFTENLYSAWIEKLFYAPAGEQPSWSPLHQVIHDPQRNFLYNHLGTAEDGPAASRAVVLKPDCADLPYFLRAYFSWKLRLPFGYRQCDRGNSKRPARCAGLSSNLSVERTLSTKTSEAAHFSYFLRRHVSYVHSGAGRTGPDDSETDLYPVALRRDSLRPGTVYVDPYGHLLIVARWVPQTEKHGGLLYAVDGHPDLSVGRKRFWRGAFLFSDQIQSGAGGFKAFRPLVQREGAIVALSNEEITSSPHYGDYSAEQYRLGLDGFYDRLDQIITPRPLTPTQAYRERLEALYELILERVGSVQLGEDYLRKTGFATIAMPRGPRIFETSGPWEDYSTPARDMRLLIAIQEVERFPQKVIAQPQRFDLRGLSGPEQGKQAMEKLFDSYIKSKRFSYQRSDKSSWTLTMGELLERQKGLEMAYNPNDCVEIRWAATGKELATCTRHSPAEQRQRMAEYRLWFAQRERPPLR